MFISGYLDLFYDRSLIRYIYFVIDLMCLLTYYNIYYNKYFIVMCIFNLNDILQDLNKYKGFTINMSCFRMTFIVATTYFNTIFFFISTNKFLSIYHLLFLIDVIATLKYIINEEKKRNETFE